MNRADLFRSAHQHEQRALLHNRQAAWWGIEMESLRIARGDQDKIEAAVRQRDECRAAAEHEQSVADELRASVRHMRAA